MLNTRKNSKPALMGYMAPKYAINIRKCSITICPIKARQTQDPFGKTLQLCFCEKGKDNPNTPSSQAVVTLHCPVL